MIPGVIVMIKVRKRLMFLNTLLPSSPWKAQPAWILNNKKKIHHFTRNCKIRARNGLKLKLLKKMIHHRTKIATKLLPQARYKIEVRTLGAITTNVEIGINIKKRETLTKIEKYVIIFHMMARRSWLSSKLREIIEINLNRRINRLQSYLWKIRHPVAFVKRLPKCKKKRYKTSSYWATSKYSSPF